MDHFLHYVELWVLRGLFFDFLQNVVKLEGASAISDAKVMCLQLQKTRGGRGVAAMYLWWVLS